MSLGQWMAILAMHQRKAGGPPPPSEAEFEAMTQWAREITDGR